MRFVAGTVEEILGLESLADQTALHVDNASQHGVDATLRNGISQGVKGEWGSHAMYSMGVKGPTDNPVGPRRGQCALRVSTEAFKANSSSGDRINLWRPATAK
ncbi:MAG: hypothetical protein BWZ07_01515 [Alphaproteobacteria bacterium ADurb.BinA280]|nr:MAG: hypothetical protein BWZ07_01515 [Alphaproteobacteria bacterium ADurb.BinA280]